ncbi:hypothetical protein [Xanthomarina sp. F2636L]|uniref:hypothetical protein n=1 Tax=Xanthomarina sp. F2636L TaxID=2996018 RepID=UPI00225E187B|nr:hypothetical protein [Xanthomarina sp. F2636L]MCX7549418.1 hypothetical protein [Xanthomarina sp. F2636L]
MRKIIKRTFSNFLMVCALSIFFSANSFAQENIQRIFDESSNNNSNLRISGSIPNELLHGKNPTIYIENSSILNITGDESPKVLKLLDASSYSLLQDNNRLYNNVEVITITLNRLSDLNNRLDLSTINGFSSLRYVYVKCMFDCSDQQIRSFLLNADSVTTVFYKVVTQS